MPLMGPRHHGLIRPAEPGLTTPLFIGMASNAVDNTFVAVPTHQAGDTLVGIGSSGNVHSSVEPAVSTAGWTRWDGVLGGTSRALAVWKITAAGAGTLCQWTGPNGMRSVWVFRDADFDIVELLDGASSTDIDWPELAGMAPDCLVGAFAMLRNTQTNVDAVAVAGMSTRISREAAHAVWAGDSNTTLLSSFNPANSTADTISSGHITAAWSMKGIPL